LWTFTFEQTSLMLAFNRERPEDVFAWNIPEGVSGEWGFGLIAPAWYMISGAKWQEGENRLSLSKEFPGMGSFSTEVTVEDEYLEGKVRIKNARNHVVGGISPGICWSFRKAKNFYPDALERTYISLGGKLTRICDTDRRRSLEGVMPVYAVKGAKGPERWRERVDNGYGWGLSEDEADDAFIGIESVDGRWATGTFYKDAYHLSFNTKGIWHGCIHSQPFLGTLAPGEEKEATGRAYIIKGSVEDLYKRFLEFMK